MTKLWLIRQTKNLGYDTYDSAVVACKDDYNAKFIHPDGNRKFYGDFDDWSWTKTTGEVVRASCSAWVHPRDVIVEYLGETDRDISGVIIASFNAG